ncbi:TetR/AcrR family transcriptional regulator [Actinoplanes teichomyceticus]|uniref:TetR family transcriptional regulator n=1 Tax=Actinoplanes teichomyceticus TaxID=1867 RepID=A0A561WPH3_ACTTI|nr:TetR/AcrR family transcriptional regulator [Actinoplanes teichomyceticus]TWG25748.1 TetR family transcriptional regulator [Actinoplanes teichomyceticus]GIF10824.1 TetR family transcriptional regulator [Actinoplanes teichomyceticus]
MARPRQALLTRERIVEAASALIDAEGLEALSMRRLATELGVQGPSLYNHFATKAEIVDAVAEAVVAQVDIGVFADCDWREGLRLWARSYHAVLAAHPNIVPVLATGPGRRPHGLAMAEAVYGALIDAGWSRSRATHIGALMRYLITGSALGSFALGFADDPELYDRYPHLHRAHELAAHRAAVDEGAFELGLDVLIAGLSDHYDQGVRR